MPEIKGIIFDLGSTLLEFESRPWEETTLDGHRRAYDHLVGRDHQLPDFEAFNARLQEIKNECRTAAMETLKEWRSVDVFERLLTEYGLDNIHEQSVRSTDVFYGLVRERLVLCEGAGEALQELKGRGYRTGLMSNTIFPEYSHEVDLEHFGLKQYLDFRIYSSEFGYRKPHSTIYEEGLRRIGLPGSAVMFVGDRYIEDIEGPQQHGISPVLKYREGRKYPDPMPEGFPVIHSLTELLDILD